MRGYKLKLERKTIRDEKRNTYNQDNLHLNIHVRVRVQQKLIRREHTHNIDMHVSRGGIAMYIVLGLLLMNCK